MADRDGFVASAAWMFSRARADGILPQMCPPKGPCNYGNDVCNGTVGALGWEGCQDLDTASFAIKLAAHIWSRLLPEEASAFYRRWAPTLARSIRATQVAPDGSGLLWSNTSRPIIGYGFQDDEIKSGSVLYSSVLAWNASRLLATAAQAHGDTALAAEMTAKARSMKSAADQQLWNATAGVFMASTGIDSSNIDIWGNAMAAATGFASQAQEGAIYRFFAEHEDAIFYEGQVRETPAWQQWEQARSVAGALDHYWRFSPQAKATARVYQNGGYWATPHHHVLPFLARHDRGMACRLLNATM